MSHSGQPPLRARLHWYQLTSDELVLLQAMVEHCSDGSTIWASISRLAAYSKLSKRKVQRLIHGDRVRGVPGLRDRGILTQLAPENTAKRRPATYRLNEDALQEDPRMAPYRNLQPALPGITRPPVPGEPVPLASAGRESGVRRTPAQDRPLVSAGRESGATGTPDSKAFDSTATTNLDPKTKIHHGVAVLNSLPAWLALKEQLRTELSSEEWDLWVRPMLLLKAMPAGSDQTHLLAALPPNSRIQSAATAKLPLLRELLAPAGFNVSLTRYPDEWEIEESRRRYGHDVAPRPWTRHAGEA